MDVQGRGGGDKVFNTHALNTRRCARRQRFTAVPPYMSGRQAGGTAARVLHACRLIARRARDCASQSGQLCSTKSTKTYTAIRASTSNWGMRN